MSVCTQLNLKLDIKSDNESQKTQVHKIVCFAWCKTEAKSFCFYIIQIDLLIIWNVKVWSFSSPEVVLSIGRMTPSGLCFPSMLMEKTDLPCQRFTRSHIVHGYYGGNIIFLCVLNIFIVRYMVLKGYDQINIKWWTSWSISQVLTYMPLIQIFYKNIFQIYQQGIQQHMVWEYYLSNKIIIYKWQYKGKYNCLCVYRITLLSDLRVLAWPFIRVTKASSRNTLVTLFHFSMHIGSGRGCAGNLFFACTLIRDFKMPIEGKSYCAGVNYSTHAATARPWYFFLLCYWTRSTTKYHLVGRPEWPRKENRCRGVQTH